MISSVWQLLSFTFVASVLLKLVYKIIRDRRPPNEARLYPSPRFFQASHLDQAEVDFGRTTTQSDEAESDQTRTDFESEEAADSFEADEEDEFESSIGRLSQVSQHLLATEASREFEEDGRNSIRSITSSQLSVSSSANSTSLHATKQETSRGNSNSNNSSNIQHNKKLDYSYPLIGPSGALILSAKFLIHLLNRSLGLIFAILDSIEGIEAPEVKDKANKESELRVEPQHQQQQQRTATRRPNYFHRRYISRRSLSAALLDDSDNFQSVDSSSSSSLSSSEDEPERSYLEPLAGSTLAATRFNYGREGVISRWTF